jgi:hypothetical protein
VCGPRERNDANLAHRPNRADPRLDLHSRLRPGRIPQIERIQKLRGLKGILIRPLGPQSIFRLAWIEPVLQVHEQPLVELARVFPQVLPDEPEFAAIVHVQPQFLEAVDLQVLGEWTAVGIQPALLLEATRLRRAADRLLVSEPHVRRPLSFSAHLVGQSRIRLAGRRVESGVQRQDERRQEFLGTVDCRPLRITQSILEPDDIPVHAEHRRESSPVRLGRDRIQADCRLAGPGRSAGLHHRRPHRG